VSHLSKNLEFRDFPTEVRVAEADGKHTFSAVVMRWDSPDTYGTTFRRGAFTESMETRKPAVLWGHDWRSPVAKVTSYSDTAEGLVITGEFADFEAVPEARKAHALLKDGIIGDFSVGFSRESVEDDPNHRGVTRITKANLPEVSIVLEASVPGTKLLSVRTPESNNDNDFTADVLARLAAGDITREAALDELANPPEEGDTGPTDLAALAAAVETELTAEEPDLVGARMLATSLLLELRATAKEPYGKVKYCDPGLQADKVKRYPVDNADHARAAWSYINQEKNAAKYSSENLARVKNCIKAAAKKYGIEVGGRSAEPDTDIAAELARLDSLQAEEF